MKQVTAYWRSNFNMPNLEIHGPHGSFDMSATFASIERHFGSNTECDDEERKNRRAEKERMKLACVRYAICGPDEDDEQRDVALDWLLPEYPFCREDCYTYFTPKDQLLK